MTEQAAPAVCQTQVWRGDTWSPRREPCGKPVKRDGLCGVHAAARDRDEARDAAERQARERADALTEKIGARVTAIREVGGRYQYVLSADAVERLLGA